MITCFVATLAILFVPSECIVHDEIAHLVREIIENIVKRDTGTHDVVVANFKDTILQKSLHKFCTCDIAYRLVDKPSKIIKSNARMSLLLVDTFSFDEFPVGNLMAFLSQTGLWQSQTKVVVLLR